MPSETLELTVAHGPLREIFSIAFFACSMLIALFVAFAAGEMHARSDDTVWLISRAHALEQQAAQDAARAQALLQGAQAEAEKQDFVIIGQGDAAQVSSL